jgi:hypothetical protein
MKNRTYFKPSLVLCAVFLTFHLHGQGEIAGHYDAATGQSALTTPDASIRQRFLKSLGNDGAVVTF